jgi:USP6 N-terminal-like protein
MCYLHTAYSMDSMFKPGFPGLLENIYVQETVMKKMMPGVYEAFVSSRYPS